MSKFYEQFRYSDWEWIVVHFPLTEREDMARTAWLIAQCSADEIAKHKSLDPRIVIPLCAIEFQDEINWEKLKEFKKEKQYFMDDFIEYCEDSPTVTNFKYFQYYKQQQLISSNFINNFVIKISNNDYWKNLFSSLELNLQIDLLYRLSNSSRRPKRNDWRYIFQESKLYEFQKSWHYWVVIIFKLLFLTFAISAIIQTITQEYSWTKILAGLALYILIVYWVVPKQDANNFIKFCFLGLLTFKRELDQLFRSSQVKANIGIFTINFAESTENEDIFIAIIKAVVLAIAMAAICIEIRTMTVVINMCITMAMLVVGAAIKNVITLVLRTVVEAWAWVGAGVVVGFFVMRLGEGMRLGVGLIYFFILMLILKPILEAGVWADFANTSRAFWVGVWAVIGVWSMVGVWAVVGVWGMVSLGATTVIAIGTMAWLGARSETGVVDWVWTIAVAIAVAWSMAGVDSGALAGVLVGVLLSIGILTWYRGKGNQNYFRYLIILAFPLFCWFPILISFATIFILRFFSWQQTLLIWLISLGVCTGLWLYGQDQERKSRNPLKGIL